MDFRELKVDDPADAALLASVPRDPVGRVLASADERAWAYGRSPAGGMAFAAVEGDEVVALYGAVSRVVLAGGKERRFAEVVEAFEARPGHLALCARGLIDAYGGPATACVLYDWPTDEHVALTSKLLAFETVRTETVLARRLSVPSPLDDAPPGDPAPRGTHPVATIERFDEQARWLYDRCAGAFGASAIRDDRFLNWRFFDRPGASGAGRYAALGVRDGEGVLRGYAVLARMPGSERVPALWIADWLVPPDELDAADALLRAVLERARAMRVQILATTLPPWSPWFARFQDFGCEVVRAGRDLMHRSFVRRYDDLWLRDGWWTTPADTLAV